MRNISHRSMIIVGKFHMTSERLENEIKNRMYASGQSRMLRFHILML
jgi:hypothetical protein